MKPPTSVVVREPVKTKNIMRLRIRSCAIFASRSKSICIDPLPEVPCGDEVATTINALLKRSTDFPENSLRSWIQRGAKYATHIPMIAK